MNAYIGRFKSALETNLCTNPCGYISFPEFKDDVKDIYFKKGKACWGVLEQLCHWAGHEQSSAMVSTAYKITGLSLEMDGQDKQSVGVCDSIFNWDTVFGLREMADFFSKKERYPQKAVDHHEHNDIQGLQTQYPVEVIEATADFIKIYVRLWGLFVMKKTNDKGKWERQFEDPNDPRLSYFICIHDWLHETVKSSTCKGQNVKGKDTCNIPMETLLPLMRTVIGIRDYVIGALGGLKVDAVMLEEGSEDWGHIDGLKEGDVIPAVCEYVPPGKISQDPIENNFGETRSTTGGSNGYRKERDSIQSGEKQIRMRKNVKDAKAMGVLWPFSPPLFFSMAAYRRLLNFAQDQPTPSPSPKTVYATRQVSPFSKAFIITRRKLGDRRG
eukprot:Nk52_evm64s153 gene=Nk52_evmTU64s153